MCIRELKIFLQQEIVNNKKDIQKHISNFEKGKDHYRNILINKNLQLIIRKNGFEKLMCIGFPFPLESCILDGFKSKKETLFFVFLRGEVVRIAQRKELIKELEKTSRVKYIEINSLIKFRDITKKLCNSYKKVDYYDPYSFLGDSFIGLHFIQAFTKKYNLKLEIVYSENYKDLEILFNTKGYVGNIRRKDKKLNIFSDLIDNQWNRTKYIVRKLAEQKLPSIICGRDLVVIPQKESINIYHFSREDILLMNENIEDYMNKCLFSFTDEQKIDRLVIKTNSQNIIINPFGSEPSKTIPSSVIVKVAKHLKDSYPSAKILLVSGFRNNYAHLLWISKLRSYLSDENIDNIIFKNYGSFAEIIKDISRYKISFGLTADTSIAHLFNYVGLTNLTFYNLDRCDLKSPQSLSSDSPLGFCRYGNIQYPVLIHNKLKYISEGVIKAVDYFLDKSDSTLWTRLVFDEKLLVSQIGKDYKDLFVSNKKINPKFKLEND